MIRNRGRFAHPWQDSQGHRGCSPFYSRNTRQFWPRPASRLWGYLPWREVGRPLVRFLTTSSSPYMYFLNQWVQCYWAVTPDEDAQRCASRSQWHIYQPALRNPYARLVRIMDLCSERPVPHINKNGYRELPVPHSWNWDHQTHSVAAPWSNGSGKPCLRLWQSKAAKDWENTSSDREICSFMGQEEKGSVIFTEHNLNTIREKNCVVSNQRGEKKKVNKANYHCFGRLPVPKSK